MNDLQAELQAMELATQLEDLGFVRPSHVVEADEHDSRFVTQLGLQALGTIYAALVDDMRESFGSFVEAGGHCEHEVFEAAVLIQRISDGEQAVHELWELEMMRQAEEGGE